jgi:hypothetical protein
VDGQKKKAPPPLKLVQLRFIFFFFSLMAARE